MWVTSHKLLCAQYILTIAQVLKLIDPMLTFESSAQSYHTMASGFIQMLRKHGGIQQDGCNEVILSVSLISSHYLSWLVY